MDSWMVGVFGALLALCISVVSFDLGRGSVADDCINYGKAHIKQTTFICTKP